MSLQASQPRVDFTYTFQNTYVNTMGYASWAPHLNHQSIYLLSAETFYFGTRILRICIPCGESEFFKLFSGAYFIFSCNVYASLLCRGILLFTSDGSGFISVELKLCHLVNTLTFAL